MVDGNLLFTMLAIHALTFLTLGPDNILVISRTTGQSLRHGIGVIIGIFLSGLVQVPAVAFGVGYLSSVSPEVWAILRIIGAIYLAYIGYKILVSTKSSHNSSSFERSESIYFVAFQGFITNLTNPKVLLLMTAFLPQFVTPENGNVSLQLFILAISMKLNELVLFTTTALVALYASRGLSRVLPNIKGSNLPQYISGTSIVGVAVWMVYDPILSLRQRLGLS